MLKIADLAINEALDHDAMRAIRGGNATPASPLIDVASIFTPSNQYGTQESAAMGFTGPQSNVTLQEDNDVIVAAPGSQVINMGGNHASSSNAASAAASSIPSLLQMVL